MTSSPKTSKSFIRAIDRLKKAANLEATKKEVELSDGSMFEMWVAPLTMAERERAQRGAKSDDANEFALRLLISKAQDENGQRLFAVGEIDVLKNEVKDADLQKLMLAVITDKEEANKTNQERVKEIEVLKGEIEELKRSTENAATRNTALAALSDAGAISADQTLSLLQDKLQKSSDGRTVILNGGVEQDLGTYINNLKNPGSGWEHHFKASSAAGMGAKPSPTSNVAPGSENPWKTGNLTQQMILSSQDPDLAAVLQREASQ